MSQLHEFVEYKTVQIDKLVNQAMQDKIKAQNLYEQTLIDIDQTLSQEIEQLDNEHLKILDAEKLKAEKVKPVETEKVKKSKKIK